MKQTGRKSRLTVPFKRIQKSHLTPRRTYNTAQNLTLRGTSKKFQFFSENETKTKLL